MKNLKKIISTVAALALTLSSFSAFAANYSDVADTASYKEAVDAISALGIVEGYPDGTFAPEKEITRAEAAKLVVNVLGPKKTAAAEQMMGTSEFSDVPGSHWASGFIAQGVALGYINGMGDGTFAPEANVTFAQMVKMLVVAAGYERDAMLAGKGNDWASGYITVANDYDFTDGVKGYSNNQNLTRGDAAILLYNALRTPICKITGWEEKLSVDANGNLTSVTVPQTEKLDGTNNKYEYETLLTTYFDAYEVRGYVTNVSKGTNEANFFVQETDNFDGKYNNAGAGNLNDLIFSGIDLDSLLMTPADAIVRENEDGDFELVSIVPYGRNEIETLDAALFKDLEKVGNTNNIDTTAYDGNLYFYKSATTNKTDDYKMSSNFAIYVNGDEVVTKTAVTADKLAAVKKYIENLDTAEVKLVNTPTYTGGRYTLDDEYDYVMISVGAYAIVSGVEVTDKKISIYFDDMDTALLGSRGTLVVDLEEVEEGEYDFTLVDVDGNEVDPATLAKNDVLTIFADFSTANLANSDYANIVVCKDVVEGKVEKAKQNESGFWAYTIGSDAYSFYKYDEQGNAIDAASTSDLTVGDTYTLYLDAYGKIVKQEVGATSINYGVITRVWTNANTEVDTVRMINANGEIVNYEAKDSDEFDDLVDDYNTAVGYDFAGNAAGTDYAYETMVVSYKLDSKDRIYDIVPVSNATYADELEYTARSNKVGSYKLSDQTVVLDLTAVSKTNNTGALLDWNTQITKYGTLATASQFVDGEKYAVVAAGTKIDGAYPFVLVVAGVDAITPTAEVCVVDSIGRDTNPVDGQVYTTVAYYVGSSEELQYAFFGSEADVEVATNNEKLAKGDMFVYTTDADGLVDEIEVLFDASAYITANKGVATSKFAAANYVNTQNVDFEYSVYTDAAVANWNTDQGNDIARWGMGVIVEKGNNDITVGKVVNGSTDLNNKTQVATIDLASDVNVFVYDVDARAAERVYKGSAGALNPTFLAGNFTNDGDKFDWTEAEKTYVKSVFFKTVDDEITDIMVVIPGEKANDRQQNNPQQGV